MRAARAPRLTTIRFRSHEAVRRAARVTRCMTTRPGGNEVAVQLREGSPATVRVGNAGALGPGSPTRTQRRRWLLAPFALASAVLLWWPRGALWLDEAQSVAIARRPLPGGVVEALR